MDRRAQGDRQRMNQVIQRRRRKKYEKIEETEEAEVLNHDHKSSPHSVTRSEPVTSPPAVSPPAVAGIPALAPAASVSAL